MALRWLSTIGGWLCAVGVAACSGNIPPDPDQVPPTDEPPAPTPRHSTDPTRPDGFVVLSPGTRLFASPSANQPSSRFRTDDHRITHDASAFEVMEREGDWVRLRNLDTEEAQAHCMGGWTVAADFDLEMWAHLSDTLRVTRAPVAETFDDGSSVKLSTGVPVGLATDSEGRVREAHGPGANARLTVPPGSVDQFYHPSALFEPGPAKLEIARSRRLLVGGHPIDTGVLRGEGYANPLFATGPLSVYDQSKRDKAFLLTVGTRCSELRALSSVEAAEHAKDDETTAAATSAGGSDLESRSSVHRADAGVPVYWPDGKPAGTVRRSHDFRGGWELEDDKRCFDVDPDEELVLCIENQDLAIVSEPEPVRTAEREPGVPRVRQLGATVKGSLDKDIIRRIVRAHINEVRYCYNEGLRDDPGLSGRVSIEFTVGPTGRVVASEVAHDTTGHFDTANCIAKAVRRWTFPGPAGGSVVVTYPFSLARLRAPVPAQPRAR